MRYLAGVPLWKDASQRMFAEVAALNTSAKKQLSTIRDKNIMIWQCLLCLTQLNISFIYIYIIQNTHGFLLCIYVQFSISTFFQVFFTLTWAIDNEVKIKNMGKIVHYHTTTEHNQATIVCIIPEICSMCWNAKIYHSARLAFSY